jgi:serine/threonine protein phosphatase 1
MMQGRQGWLDRLLGRGGPRPCVPEGACVYAIGDIHGRDDLLEQLLGTIMDRAARTNQANHLVFLGDYVDRGLQSRQVLDRLIDLELPGWKITYLRGNHDQAILDFLDDPGFYRSWRVFGAAETLLSYGVTPPKFEDDQAFAKARDEFRARCPARHLDFLQGLPYAHEIGDYFFVHAGVRPGIALAQQTAQDMMWIREEFIMSQRAFGKVIVHGHTPTERPVKRANRIGVDTGAYATNVLTAAILHDDTCEFISTGNLKGARADRREASLSS